jgi:hypothetical protein
MVKEHIYLLLPILLTGMCESMCVSESLGIYCIFVMSVIATYAIPYITAIYLDRKELNSHGDMENGKVQNA